MLFDVDGQMGMNPIDLDSEPVTPAKDRRPYSLERPSLRIREPECCSVVAKLSQETMELRGGGTRLTESVSTI